MWNLIAELSLLFLIVAITSWLMGRYFCKSGEVEQRSLKNELSKKKDLLQSQLKKRDTEFKSGLEQINESETLIAGYEQQIAALRGQTGALDDEREQLIADLQGLKQTENQLNTLIEDHKYEKEQHHRYREKTIELMDQRDDLVTLRNRLGEQLNTSESSLQTKTIEAEASGNTAHEQEAMIKNLESERDEAIENAKTEKAQITQQLESDKDKAIQRLEIERDKEIQRLQTERDQTVYKLKTESSESIKKLTEEKEGKIQQLVTAKENALQNLSNKKDGKIQAILKSKDEALQKAEHAKNEAIQTLNSHKNTSTMQLNNAQEEHQYSQDENQKLQSRFKLVDSENEIIKQRIEEHNKDYLVLQEKYTLLNEASVSFERKLRDLEERNTELRHSIEAVTIENNDYLGRLRAISSVVDVVGTEPNRIISLNSSTN
jgi:chromosome segregation ATPase